MTRVSHASSAECVGIVWRCGPWHGNRNSRSRRAAAAFVDAVLYGSTDGKGEYMTPAKSVFEREGARNAQSPVFIRASCCGVGSATMIPPSL
eukprot:6212027-Pleurochrysis_carterae.AAC.1